MTHLIDGLFQGLSYINMLTFFMEDSLIKI